MAGLGILSIIIGVVLLVVGVVSRSQARRIETLPVTRCGQVKPGLVQVEGKAAGQDHISSIVFRMPCYVCQAELMPEGHRSVTRKQEATRFKVQDGSGAVLVDPAGADLDLKRNLRVIAREGRVLEHEGEGNPEDLAQKLFQYGHRAFHGIIHESNLCTDDPVLVIGTAVEIPATAGEPVHMLIHKAGTSPLYIAESSKEGAVAESRTWMKIGLVIGLLFIAAGAFLLLLD